MTTEELENVTPTQNSSSSSDGINVIARIRPFLKNEVVPEAPCIYKKENYIITQDPANRTLTSEHLFDAVYGPEADQVDVF